MDRFEQVAENVFTQLNLESTIERIDHLEKQMYLRISKYHLSAQKRIVVL